VAGASWCGCSERRYPQPGDGLGRRPLGGIAGSFYHQSSGMMRDGGIRRAAVELENMKAPRHVRKLYGLCGDYGTIRIIWDRWRFSRAVPCRHIHCRPERTRGEDAVRALRVPARQPHRRSISEFLGPEERAWPQVWVSCRAVLFQDAGRRFKGSIMTTTLNMALDMKIRRQTSVDR
jgi:hypothetical protein